MNSTHTASSLPPKGTAVIVACANWTLRIPGGTTVTSTPYELCVIGSVAVTLITPVEATGGVWKR